MTYIIENIVKTPQYGFDLEQRTTIAITLRDELNNGFKSTRDEEYQVLIKKSNPIFNENYDFLGYTKPIYETRTQQYLVIQPLKCKTQLRILPTEEAALKLAKRLKITLKKDIETPCKNCRYGKKFTDNIYRCTNRENTFHGEYNYKTGFKEKIHEAFIKADNVKCKYYKEK
jgi:hypothetical protein